MPDELYVSREQYVDFPEPQVPTPVRQRSIARAGHPIIARTPQMWVPLTVDYEVEQPKAKTEAKAEASESKASSRRGARD
jgi:hypothetical protein